MYDIISTYTSGQLCDLVKEKGRLHLHPCSTPSTDEGKRNSKTISGVEDKGWEMGKGKEGEDVPEDEEDEKIVYFQL